MGKRFVLHIGMCCLVAMFYCGNAFGQQEVDKRFQAAEKWLNPQAMPQLNTPQQQPSEQKQPLEQTQPQYMQPTPEPPISVQGTSPGGYPQATPLE